MENDTTFGTVDVLDGNPDNSGFGVPLAEWEEEQDKLEEWTVLDNDFDN